MSTQFTVHKGTLDGSSPQQIDPNTMYMVDFSKMESVNDLVVILAAMGISFPATHPHFDQVKRLLNLDNPIPIQQPNVQPEGKKLSLPKLKTLK
jgi:hypothetical protein